MRQAFRKAILKSYTEQCPFVVYSSRESLELSGIFQRNENGHGYNPGDRGFIFSPFSSEAKTLFLPLEKCDMLTTSVERSGMEEDVNSIKLNSNQKNPYIKLVSQAIEQINSDRLKKVVVSRKQDVPLTNFDLLELLLQLFTKNVSAFRYAWFHPESGLWVGATPEVLLTVSDNHYKTMSLAGTRSANLNEQNNWTSKEFHEQQLVTDVIAGDMESFSERMSISEVRTVRAGNLEHLRTDIEGELRSGYNWWDLATILHPTPAVCGSPKAESMDFILKNEGYNREYYTGFFGPTFILEGQTDLYVNLRCMRIRDSVATIYTGGGITRGSDPAAEWEETCNKQQTMLKLLSQFL